MTTLDQILTAAPTVRVGLTLLHLLWQAALVAAVLAVALRLLRRRSANVRYLVATGALLVLAATPVATFLAVEAAAPAAAVTIAPPAVKPPQAPPAEPLPEPPRETYTAEPAGGGHAPSPEVGTRTVTPRPVVSASHDRPVAAAPAETHRTQSPPAPPPSWRRRAETAVRAILPHVVGGWACGVLLLALWRLGGWRGVRRLRHVSTRDVRGPLAARFAELADALGVRRAVRLLTSTVAAVPMVVGYFRPVVLLPTAAVAGLTPQQVEAILAHELAHIRRHDFLVNTIQIVIETLLFYHPAVWWISRRIRAEREDCCDDAAVAVCPSRVTYARALATLAELPSGPAIAVAASGGRLLARIRRIVGLAPAPAGGDTRRWGAWAAAAVVLLGLVTAGAVFYGCGTETRGEDAPEPATWSKAVNGLQCRLHVANDELAFEVRNASDKPVTIGLHNGGAPPLDIRIKDYPRLSSPAIYSGMTPHVLKPGRTIRCKLAQHHLLAYGRRGGGFAWRFDPAGKTYRIRAMLGGLARGGLVSNEVSVKLPHRAKPARHWPPPGRRVSVTGAWSKPSPEGLQTRIAAHASAFAQGESIVLRVELRHQDGKSWARGVAGDRYVGTIVVDDVTGKTVGRGKIGLDFHTVIRKNETRVIGLMDLSDKAYGVTAQGKYTARFEHTLPPASAKRGLVALPAAPPFELIVLPAGSGHGRPPKPPAGRADPEAARAKARRLRLADVPMVIVAIGGGDPDLRATLHAAMNLWSDEKIPHTGNGAADRAAWEKWWNWRPGEGLLSRAEIARRVRRRPRQPGDDSHAHVPKYYARTTISVPVTPPGGKLRTVPKTFERIWVVGWVPGRLAQGGGHDIVLDAATGNVLVRAAHDVKKQLVTGAATWSKAVNGLQCRLTVAADKLTFEVRNGSDKPITIGLHNGVALPLGIHIKNYPRLQSLPIYPWSPATPHVLEPGRTFGCKLAQHFFLAYNGRGGDPEWRFDPAGKTYRVRVTMHSQASGGEKTKYWTGGLVSNEVSVRLPRRAKPARHWPPPGLPAPLAAPWSEPSPDGLQTRIAAHAKAFALGESIPMRVELRHKDGKSWARSVALTLYRGTIILADAAGKIVGRRTISLHFSTSIGKNETRVLALMDLSNTAYALTAAGKYTVRFEDTPMPNAAKRGLAALPAAPAFELTILPAAAGKSAPAKPPVGRVDQKAVRARVPRLRLADVPITIVAIGGGDADLRATLHAALNLWTGEKIQHTGDAATDRAAWEKWWNWRPGKGLLSREEIARRVLRRPRHPGDGHALVPKYYARATVAVPVTPHRGKITTVPKTFDHIWVVPWVPGRLAQIATGYQIVLDAGTGKVLVRAAHGVKRQLVTAAATWPAGRPLNRFKARTPHARLGRTGGRQGRLVLADRKTRWLVGCGGKWLIWRVDQRADPGFRHAIIERTYYRQELGKPELTQIKRTRGTWQVGAVLDDGTVLFCMPHGHLPAGRSPAKWAGPMEHREVNIATDQRHFVVVQGYPDGLVAVPRASNERVFLYWIPIVAGKIAASRAIKLTPKATCRPRGPAVHRAGSVLAWANEQGLQLFDLGSRRLRVVSLASADVQPDWCRLDAFDGRTAVVQGYGAVDVRTGTRWRQYLGEVFAVDDGIVYSGFGHIYGKKLIGREMQSDFLAAVYLASKKVELLCELPRDTKDVGTDVLEHAGGLYVWDSRRWRTIPWRRSVATALWAAPRRLTRDHELALRELLRRSEVVVVGKLRLTNDSTANKMWAGHIDVSKVLRGKASLRDVHVHFQDPNARGGSARRYEGQEGIWFVFRDGNQRTVVWPSQLKPAGFETTLRPYLKANYTAPAPKSTIPADAKVTMRICDVGRKPVPLPPRVRRVFLELLARPAGRCAPVSALVAEDAATFEVDGKAYAWSGSYIQTLARPGGRLWPRLAEYRACPRLESLFHLMMKERTPTDQRLAGVLQKFDQMLAEGKVPARTRAAKRASESLAATRQMLTKAVGGRWVEQTIEHHPLGPILVGRVEIAEIKNARPARAGVYVVLPFRLKGAGRWRVFSEYGDRGFSVLGTNDARTVLTNASARHEPASRTVMKTLALSPTRITLAAMELAGYFKRHPAKFALTVRYADGKPTGRGRLRLATAAPVGAPAGERFVRISEHRVRLLVDHLLEQGMLEPFGQRVAPGAWPRCLLEIHADLPGSTRAEVIRNDLGGRLAVQGHVVGLRQWLTGKSAAAMDKLLVAVDALADTDNGLQLWLKVRRATLEWGEPVRAIAELRYLKEDPNRVLGDATTARGRALVLCADGPGGKQRKTVEIRRLAGLMALRPDPPTAEWFSVNLGEHLTLRQLGVYRVWAEHAVKPGGKAGAWSGSVRTAAVRIEIKPHPSGLLWSRPVEGLRGSIRPLREGKRLKVEVRLQNAGTKRLTILPFDEGKLNYERTYGAAIWFWLLSPEGNSVEKEQPDAAPGLRRLKMLAQDEQPGFPGVRLLGGELYKTTISVDGAGETGHFHRLAKARHDRPGKLAAVYDTRRFAALARKILREGVWNAHLMIPAVAIPLAIPEAPARGEARAARVLALAGEADRIVVGKALPQQEGEAPLRIDVTKTLKGSLAGGARQNVMLIGERESPRSDLRDEDKHVIILLRVEGHNRGWAQLLPPRPINWFLPWSQVFEKRLRAAIPLPAKWGQAIGGLRLGLRPRGTKFTLGGEISVEIAIQNVGARGVKLLQHRLNIYDYYGFTRFTITDPKGRRFVLAKPVGPMLEADFALARTLRPGEAYIHTVHLNCWPLATDMGAPQKADPRGPFAVPGMYTVHCTYRSEAGKKRGCWSGILISPEVRFEIVRPARPAAKPKPAAPAKWATSDVALASAVSRAATVVRATAKDAGQIFRRQRMTYSAGRPGRGITGGGVFEHVQRRQTFRVAEVLWGSHQAGELTVSYSYRESGKGRPAPKIRIGIPAKAAVILLLDAAGKLLKALPDTPANRAAVKKQTARARPAIGTGVTTAPRGFRRLWDDLGSGDTAVARKAMWTLGGAAPEHVAPFLAGGLAPPAADAAVLKRLIADLDSEKSAVRAKAFDALGRMDRAAEAALRGAGAKGVSAEVRERVDLLLAACKRPLFETAATRRMVRAIWALELIGGAGARAALVWLSKLDARCRTTHLAAAALARLAGRPERGGQYAPKLRYEVEPANSPDANRIKLDGRMRLKVRLVNAGLVPVAVYWGDYPYEDMYRFAVTREDGGRVPPPRKRFTPPLPVLKTKYFPEIAPGRSVSYDVYLMPDPAANAQTYFFRRPGKHTIRASFATAVRAATERDTGTTRAIGGVWTGVLTAPTVTVTVAGDAKVLTEGRRLSGRVVDAAGKGVVDAKVLVARRVRTDIDSSSYKGPFYEQAVEHTFTTADGGFSFIRLPGDVACFVLTATHPRRASATAKVIATGAAKLPDARIVLPAGLTARGVVVDSAGRALAGVRVDRGDRTTFTDPKGRFVLAGLPNEEPVRLSLWKGGFVARDAGTTREEATGGKWSVTLWRKRKLAFSGRAVFADGRPAAKLRLWFDLKHPSGRSSRTDTRTDSSGHFTAQLSGGPPGGGGWPASVEAEKEDPSAGHHRRWIRCRWWTTVEGIAAGRKDVKIVFDDRGEIAVVVKPTNVLPTSFKFDVRCQRQGIGGFFRVAELGSKGGRTTFRRLSPGEYMVYAKATASPNWQWKRKLTVGSEAKNRKAEAEFVLPPLRFGRFRALVLGPDGKTPVRNGQARYGGSASSGSVVIRDGLVEVKDFPVGGVYLEISGVADMARRVVRGMVYEGRTTDLGRIVLQRLEDVSGWVTGRVLYDDGSPALGATVVHESFRHTPVKADGGFRAHLPAGEGTVVVDLAGAAAWPGAGSGGPDADNVWRITDRILAPVEVKPGKTVQRDIVVPRTRLGKLSVHWKAKAETHLGILVVVERKDCRFVRTVFRTTVAPGTIELRNVPAGAKVIALSSLKTGNRGCKTVPADKAAVTFDLAAVGSIAVRTAGGPIPGLKLSARPAVMAWVKPLRGLRSDWAPIGSGAVTIPPPKDGRSVLAGLCPGKYVVEAQPEGLFAPKTVSVAAGGEVTVELVERAKLPGNSVTLEEAIKIKGGIEFIAVCEASENVSPTPGPSGVYGAIQRFKVATVLTGAAAGGKSIRLWYSVLFPPKQERTIRKGERVIWVVQKVKDGKLVGIKALADTPKNRAAVAKAVPKAKPKPPAGIERVRPAKRPPEPSAGPKDFERLLRALKARLPAGWVASVTTGKVKPVHWPEGQGTLISLASKDFKPLDLKLGKGGQVRIWVMAEDYTAKRPAATGAQTHPAVERWQWCRRRVLVWPGGERGVPERTIGQALGATWRAAVLLRKLDSFTLALRFRDANDRSRPSVVMSVADTNPVRISKADARKIIEYLMMEGFLGQAVDPTVMMGVGVRVIMGPRYVLSAGTDEYACWSILGWGWPMLKRLVGLRSVLTGDAAKQMDTVLEQMRAKHGDRQGDIRAEILFDKAEYFIGENILLHYRLTNRSARPLTVDTGGDQRTNARRPLRLKVVAVDAKGTRAEDPCPWPMCMGGRGGPRPLKPGQTFWMSVPLMRYCEFDRPGVYHVRAYHDLGWDPGGHNGTSSNDVPLDARFAPVVEATVKLVLPTAAQARQVVRRMQGMPADPGWSLGKRRDEFPDFTTLRHPVYLPIVTPLAREGKKAGFDALAAAATPGATRALIELARSPKAATAATAMDALVQRLPDPNVGKHPSDATRRRLIRRSWRADMAPAVVALAWELLARKDRKDLIRGGRIVRALGRKEDMPRLLKVFDRTLTLTKDDDVEQRAYPRPANACGGLLHATRALLDRGAAPPTDPRSAGEAALFLIAVGTRKDFRPDGWRRRAVKLLKHPIPYVRALAAGYMPLPLDDAAVRAAAELVHDEYPPVQSAACALAAKTRLKPLGPPLLEAVRTSKNRWIIPAAYRAAEACGVGRDQLVEACIRRIDQPGMNKIMFTLLVDWLIHNTGYGQSGKWADQAGQIKTRWLTFLEANRKSIRDGVRFEVAQPPLTANLFPRGFQLHRRDLPPWPPKQRR